ncbi:hypothetical protein BWR60_00560 [Inquilinus limosus]|uniref:3-ketoacyl-ACP reductase n=2 Tax=Inquilinus limosus TaxID=171674 RepID=A0A211ZUV8_9PROT|nr:hypothetical protein BWR60_00560 [Inquilinus limosus]
MLTAGGDRLAVKLSCELRDESGTWFTASWFRPPASGALACHRQLLGRLGVEAVGEPAGPIGEPLGITAAAPSQDNYPAPLHGTSRKAILPAKANAGAADPAPRRSAIVTGGSRGIGAAIVKRLVQDGFAVAINYVRYAEGARDLAAAITDAGGRVIAVQADVSDPMAVTELFDAARSAFGGVDVLVNNAGIMKTASVATSDDALIDSQIAVNLKGTFNTLREATRMLRDNGRIINVSSSAVGLFQPNHAVYAATKAGVEAITRVLSKELRGRSITVNAVAPGPTATPLFLDGKPQEVVDRLASIPPLERLGTPFDIAAAVAFLAGPDGGWINGQVLRANGGVI